MYFYGSFYLFATFWLETTARSYKILPEKSFCCALVKMRFQQLSVAKVILQNSTIK